MLPSRYSDQDVREMALNCVSNLVKYGTYGLPAVYEDVPDYLHDFYPDLPWDRRSKESIQIILDHPNFPIIKQLFLDRYDFDWEAELRFALTYEPE